jgi:hypothetical protein
VWLTEENKEIWGSRTARSTAPGACTPSCAWAAASSLQERVGRLARETQISGLICCRQRGTTIGVPGVRVPDDLVKRGFRPPPPNVLSCADIVRPEAP